MKTKFSDFRYTTIVGTLGFFILFGSANNVVAAKLGWPGYDLKGTPCHGQQMGYGPYDYTNPDHRQNNLPIVEEYHFTREMEAKAGIDIKKGSQFAYTLRAFPNHHRALYAVVRHQLRFDEEIYQKSLTDDRYTPAECYFQKAIVFAPKDIKVYQLYAYYLGKKDKYDEVIKLYQQALRVEPQGRLHYQLAKAYFKTKQYVEAVKHAQLALDDGYQRQDMKKKLQAIGKWPS